MPSLIAIPPEDTALAQTGDTPKAALIVRLCPDLLWGIHGSEQGACWKRVDGGVKPGQDDR